MLDPPLPDAWRPVGGALGGFGHAQHRNAFYLVLSTAIATAAGIVFWLLFTRVAGLDTASIGIGFVLVALATIIAVVAKGGLDAALVRTVPGSSRAEGARLLRLGTMTGIVAAVALTAAIALLWEASHVQPALGLQAWSMVAAMAVLLLTTWLQDAYFLGCGDAGPTARRTLVFSLVRIALPIPIVLIGFTQPVALAWLLALGVSALVGLASVARIAPREGRRVPSKEFLRSALWNVPGSAADFLPGLLLAPLVLALHGPVAAAHFGMAWTAASLLFLVAAGIARSAMAEIAAGRAANPGPALGRAAWQGAAVLLPAALIGIGFAPFFLGIFGAGYAAEGATSFRILIASVPFVGAWYLRLALLRARKESATLVWTPLLMLILLLGTALALGARLGPTGVAIAWLAVNAPFGIHAAWTLRAAAREVMRHPPTSTLRGIAHPE